MSFVYSVQTEKLVVAVAVLTWWSTSRT